LFFTFASGPPGIGLLMLRLLTGATLIAHNLTMPAAVLAVASIVLGLLIIVGLWTPVTGLLIAASAFWDGATHPRDRYFIIVGVLGLALALLGPGAWSVDARLFGWKRL
jgi:uncharacterized membrane protein YphA (DoxX/SURF4 family)